MKKKKKKKKKTKKKKKKKKKNWMKKVYEATSLFTKPNDMKHHEHTPI